MDFLQELGPVSNREYLIHIGVLADETSKTPQQIKEQFRQRGVNFSAWAREHGYSPQRVIRVLNGFEKGHYGQAHEIAVKLGLKPQSQEFARQAAAQGTAA